MLIPGSRLAIACDTFRCAAQPLQHPRGCRCVAGRFVGSRCVAVPCARLAKFDAWYSAAHGWLMLEAQGDSVEADKQKRLALVSWH